MKKIILLVIFQLFIFLPGSQSFAQGFKGYKGYFSVETTLKERWLLEKNTFSLINHAGGYYFAGSPSLADLLGLYALGTDSQFINSTPNPLNALVWNVIFLSLSEEISKVCDAGQVETPFQNQMRPEVRETFLKVCSWPNVSAKKDEVLLAVWFSVVDYDAPESEYIAFRNFFLNSEYSSKSGKEVLAAMILAMLNQPYFLLGQ